MSESTTAGRRDPAAPESPPPRAGGAVIPGLVAGAVGVGIALLARAVVPGAGQPWSTPVLLASAAAALLVGAVAGVAGRARRSAGLAVLVLGGAAATVLVALTVAGAAPIAIPLSGTLAAAVTFLLCFPAPRPDATEASDADGDTETGAPVPRRRALLLGAALAIGTATAGLLVHRTVVAGPRRAAETGPSPAAGEPLRRGTVVDARSLGATGDGSTDDSAALQRGLAAAAAAGGTLYLPAGTYRCASPTTLRLPAGVTLSGDPARSVVEFTAGAASGSCVVVDAPDVTIDGVVLRRGADVETVLLGTGAFERFTLSRSILDGATDRFPDRYCHGIKLSDNARAAGMRIVDSTVTGVVYGLFQTNASTAVTTDVVVERCLFSRNRNTDLEFNSPAGATRQVTVRACRFEDNDSTGFGVGFAKVDGVTVSGNTFRNYAMEAVHVEDYSSDVVVESNDFASCGLKQNSYVQILSGSRSVTVRSNSFDARSNEVRIFAVTSQPGGSGTTVSGGPIVGPSGTVVRDNYVGCSPAVTPIYFEGATGGVITGNGFSGDALGGPDSVLVLLQSPDTEVSDNTVNGSPL